MSGQTFIWDSPGIHASQDQIAKKLGGGKSGITANGTMTSALAIVVTAGQTGWELVAIQGKDEFGITYWLKRPLP